MLCETRSFNSNDWHHLSMLRDAVSRHIMNMKGYRPWNMTED